jgi:hypothetical protein
VSKDSAAGEHIPPCGAVCFGRPQHSETKTRRLKSIVGGVRKGQGGLQKTCPNRFMRGSSGKNWAIPGSARLSTELAKLIEERDQQANVTYFLSEYCVGWLSVCRDQQCPGLRHLISILTILISSMPGYNLLDLTDSERNHAWFDS